MPSGCDMNVERSSSHDKIFKRNYRGNGVKSAKSSAERSRASSRNISAKINVAFQLLPLTYREIVGERSRAIKMDKITKSKSIRRMFAVGEI